MLFHVFIRAAMMVKHLLYHAIQCFQQKCPFILRTSREFSEQLLCLLLNLRHIRIKQNICRQTKPVNHIGKDFDRRIDFAFFNVLDMAKPPAGLLGKLLLRQMFLGSFGAYDFSYML